jgi:tripeptidyl-peptidase-1
MKYALGTIVGVVILMFCEAIPTSKPTYSLHEKRTTHSKVWSRGNRVNGDDIVPVRIGLTQTNLNDGYAHLMDV